MKKTKRLFAVTLAALVLVCALPLNVFAATTVRNVDLTLDVEPGTIMEDYEEYITINSKGVEFCDSFGFTVDVSEVYEEELYWPSTEYFTYGCEYELMILLTAQSGYSIPESTSQVDSVTVNGEEVYFEIVTEADEFGEMVTMLVVYASVIMENVISNVELTVAPVVYYDIADYERYITIESLGVDFETTLDTPVAVTDSFGADPFNYFIEDEEYAFEICLTPAWGCEFAKDEEGNISLGKVTVNGEAVDYSVHVINERGYIEYIIISFKTTCEIKNIIEVIEITLSEDLKGCDTADYNSYITIETEGVSFDTYDPEPVEVYDADYNWADTFKAGNIYIIYMDFITEEGYVFSPDGVGLVVNGVEYSMVTYDSYYPEEGLRVEYVSFECVTSVGGTFFDLVIAWFDSIFDSIMRFFFGWLN